MKKQIVGRIIELIVQAQGLALKIGIPNILQPGLVKEMIIAETLGHTLIYTKRDAGSGQIDRMFKEPKTKREESLQRIWRNTNIYLAVFYRDNPLKIKTIYEILPAVLAQEAERQLDRSSNAISHVGFSEKWAYENGKIVYSL